MHYHIEEINQRLTTSFATYEKAQLRVNIVNNEYKTVLNKTENANFIKKNNDLLLTTDTIKEVMENMKLEQKYSISWSSYALGKGNFH